MANVTPKAIQVTKYGHYWAVYLDDELLAVIVYRKGAFAVKDLLTNLYAQIANAAQSGSADIPDERPNRD